MPWSPRRSRSTPPPNVRITSATPGIESLQRYEKRSSAYAWNRIYKRAFRDAIVLVNPRNESVTVTLLVSAQLAVTDGGGQTGDAQLDANRNYIGGTVSYSNMKAVTVGPQSAVLPKRK